MRAFPAIAASLFLSAAALAQNAASVFIPPQENAAGNGAVDPERVQFETRVAEETRRKINLDLSRYCLDFCSLVSVKVVGDEQFDIVKADLGFENVAADRRSARQFRAKSVTAEILVDSRFGAANFARLRALIERLSQTYESRPQLAWSNIPFPDSAADAQGEQGMRAEIANRAQAQLEKIVSEFCPRECRINSVSVSVDRGGIDEAAQGDSNRFVFNRAGGGVIRVRGAEARVTLDAKMDLARRSHIESLMRESLASFGEAKLQSSLIPFPRSAEELQKDADATRADPYGLERMGALLRLFKEHANTKEIIKERDVRESTSSTERNSNSTNSNSSTNSSTNSSLSEKEKEREAKESLTNTNEKSQLEQESKFWTRDNMLIAGGLAAALLLVAALGLRHVLSGNRMKGLIEEGRNSGGSGGGRGQGNDSWSVPTVISRAGMAAGEAGMGFAGGGNAGSGQAQLKIQLQNLRDDVMQYIVSNARVARDVFSRILREEGPEPAAKLISIFGEVLVYELLNDPEAKSELGSLAEYMHMNSPDVRDDEQLRILKGLRLKLTAGKMRMHGDRTAAMFDFIKAKGARQIAELIGDERAQAQALVLTQLSRDKRREVFDLIAPAMKGEVMRELSNTEAVSREYLVSFADALKKKASLSPMFNAENLRGSDVLVDLLERADLVEQRQIIAGLDRSQPEIALRLRSSLVSVEILPLLRPNLLIELFINLDPASLGVFLAGTREHIRQAVLQRAPADIATNWRDAMQAVRRLDAEHFRIAEQNVVARLRAMADSGLVPLYEVNCQLYGANGAAPVTDQSMLERQIVRMPGRAS